MKIKERFAAAIKAFRTGQVTNRLTVGIEVKRCSECESFAPKCTECRIYHSYMAILDLPDCNDCAVEKDCSIKVGPGEFTRINCYHHKPMNEEANG